MQGELREVGRTIVAATYNQLEPEQPRDAPAAVVYESAEYRRLNTRTPRRQVSTLFGTITLWRRGYRDVDGAEPQIFPVELALGLVQGATPALAEVVARAMSEAGATQQVALNRLREEHGVAMGVKRLRALIAEVESQLTPQRRQQQVQQMAEWLETAEQSSGKNRPVLSVGRDGITLATRPHGFFEVATVATLTVYDRSQKRLGSVYLGVAPELGQATMSDELTALIQGVLTARTKKLPRLVYLTDAGDSECAYFDQVLRTLRHPTTEKPLEWQRIFDYYHAAQRLTTMAEALFGAETRAGQAWAAKMRQVLKKPNGVFRVLHSAAALSARRELPATRQQEYRRAYHYLRDRAKHLRYHEYRRLGLPIGSGVTEAACKTLFTQRLKLSGMRWSEPGAQLILNLRSIRLSGIWDATHRAYLKSRSPSTPRTPADSASPSRVKAA